MNEREKIIKLLEKYQAIFDTTDMDVAESRKGHWLFLRFNDENGYFDAVAHFETAEELAEIMLGELAMDIMATIDGRETELPAYENVADDLVTLEDYEPHITRLLEYLGR